MGNIIIYVWQFHVMDILMSALCDLRGNTNGFGSETYVDVVTAILSYISQLRKLRERDATKFHVQLCIALFLMLLVFVIGIDKTDNSVGCLTVSVLIFYFTLVSFMWMAAEALLMFQKLVIVFVHITTRYIIVLSTVCWSKHLPYMYLYSVLATQYIMHIYGTRCLKHGIPRH